MTQSAASVAAKKPRGKPFQKGEDARRNLGGRRTDPFQRAITEFIDKNPGSLNNVVRVAFAQAESGDPQARAWLADRGFGKSVARQENGEPGAFDLELDDARKVLRIDGKKAG